MFTLKRNLRGLIKIFSNNDVNAQAFCIYAVVYCIQGGTFCLSRSRPRPFRLVYSGLTGRVSDSRVFRRKNNKKIFLGFFLLFRVRSLRNYLFKNLRVFNLLKA